MSVEIWLTSVGCVALGLDTYERLSNRRKLPKRREGFLVGHEPLQLSADAVVALLDLAASGKFTIEMGMLSRLGIAPARALVSQESKEALERAGCPKLEWVKVTASVPDEKSGPVVYAPWSGFIDNRERT